MIHFHATQKLLNTSRLKPVLYVSEPSPNQRMHSWYVVLCGSSFPGKMLLLYIHEPSFLTVVVKGKTIASTIDSFRKQLKQLLERWQFPTDFIELEMNYFSDYVIGKTASRSMLSHINQMVLQVTDYNMHYMNYEDIDTIYYEDIFMDWLYKIKGQKDYQTPQQYWKKVFYDTK